jgi:serine/threonine-protein kinase
MFSRHAKIALAAFVLSATAASAALAQSEVPREKAYTSGRTVGRDAMPRGSTPGVVGGGTGADAGSGGSAGGANAAGAAGAGAAGAGGANGGGSAGGGGAAGGR